MGTASVVMAFVGVCALPAVIGISHPVATEDAPESSCWPMEERRKSGPQDSAGR
jgi:hypothetical protein